MHGSSSSGASSQLRRVGFASLIAMSLGLVVLVFAQGFSTIGASARSRTSRWA